MRTVRLKKDSTAKVTVPDKHEIVVKKTPKKKSEVALIVIPAPDYRAIELAVKGVTPLIINAWGIDSIKVLQTAQSGAPKTRKREARNPEAEFNDSRYRIKLNGKVVDCVATTAFRQACIAACRTIDGMTMTTAKQLFVCPDEFTEIISPPPVMRTDPVRLASGVSSLAYRPEYWPWSCKLRIDYNAGATTPEQIINLLILAGRSVGIGEKRVAKGFNNGQFTVE